MDPKCPPLSFQYNTTLCSCYPGRYLSRDTRTCELLEGGEWRAGSINYRVVGGSTTAVGALLGEVLGPLDSVEKVVRSETVVVKATVIVVLLWLAFCVAVRFGRVDGGRTVWFRMRWWVSRLDLRFGTKHLLEDLGVVRKRKTELGGALSVASWILFVGLLSALLYQVITRRSIEVHRVRPINAPDLLSFVNDMEFNITTVSSMSCSHLQGLNQLVIGAAGSIYFKVYPLSNYVNYTCYNTSRGPKVSLKCNSCKIPSGDFHVSWTFIDLPNDPASAVGFQFNLTAKAHGNDRHLSYVSGTLRPGSSENDTPHSLRGQDMNILKIHLFPQKFNYLHNLRLIQPLLHDFLPGSSFSKVRDLRASLENSKDGLVNTTLYVRYLSDYIVEIDRHKVVGIVSFLAEVGGLYTISLAIFLYFLLQCEARFKKLRFEDSVMRDIRSQRRAQRHWDTVRKYVNYTWGRSNLDMRSKYSRRHDSLMADPFCGVCSLHKIKQPSQRSSIYYDKMADIPNQTEFVPDIVYTGAVKSWLAGSPTNFDGMFSHSETEHEIDDTKVDEERRHAVSSVPQKLKLPETEK